MKVLELALCVYIYVRIKRYKIMNSKYNWLYRVIFVLGFVGFLWWLS